MLFSCHLSVIKCGESSFERGLLLGAALTKSLCQMKNHVVPVSVAVKYVSFF